MRRKLIKQGLGGLTFYVPKKWSKRLNLKAGDEIDVEEEGNILMITPEKITKDEKITINTTDMNDNSLKIALVSAYWQGFETIILISKKPFKIVKVNKLVGSLVGLVVTDQSDNKIEIKNVASENIEDVEKIINKIFITTHYQITKAIELFEGDVSHIEEIKELKKAVTKQGNYCRRIIFSTNFGKSKSYEYNIIILLHKKITSILSRFCSSYNKLSPKFKKETKNYLIKIEKWFSQLQKSYLKSDITSALKMHDLMAAERDKLYISSDYPPALSALMEFMFSLSSRIISVLIK
ncbi:hypothetical protein HN695_07560 [Candidatus Woesearchaeota archaeon]|jgi:phosphate uptake regulator|nr:hypothetical protein [Candidatus Woesearchaeota archaeon]MBT5272645.1 hypothetical protein [Candidatus Woesearchaeota archaeon]MBT6041718.1 hypothetical protein [Candidatus Woesearchaeota archaeon]MBT6337197.1 hypothetical protein [Candidatus Woesearchaeota archaeon]MBT7928165.1 hypothetical protein [Candidatus Woesearchaeota archaeon]